MKLFDLSRVLRSRLSRFLAMSCFYYLKSKRKTQKQRSAPELNEGKRNSSGNRTTRSARSVAGEASSRRGIPDLYEEKAHNLRAFSFLELRNATNGFSRLLKVGEGGFGSVYKGFIQPPDGQGERSVAAIKKLNNNGLQVVFDSFV